MLKLFSSIILILLTLLLTAQDSRFSLQLTSGVSNYYGKDLDGRTDFVWAYEIGPTLDFRLDNRINYNKSLLFGKNGVHDNRYDLDFRPNYLSLSFLSFYNLSSIHVRAGLGGYLANVTKREFGISRSSGDYDLNGLDLGGIVQVEKDISITDGWDIAALLKTNVGLRQVPRTFNRKDRRYNLAMHAGIKFHIKGM